MGVEITKKTKFTELWFLQARVLAVALLAGRMMTGLAFMSLALGEIRHYGDFSSACAAIGLPSGGVFCVSGILLVFSGAVSLLLGFYARIGAAVLLLVSLCALPFLLFGHANMLVFAAALAVAGGMVPYIVAGGGEFCLDKLYGEAGRLRASRRRHLRR
ncbi:MAG: DoxX family membrane protein [Elusimicrobiaceae bacterium]|nr:DoxX family membrane protein [Elusimicrobiaceae bacterium]